MRILLALALLACCFSCLSCNSANASGPVNTGSPTINASAYPNLQAAIDAIPSTGGTLVIDGQFEANGQSCLSMTGQLGPCIYRRSNIRILGDGVTSKIYTTATNIIGLYILASDMITVSGVEFAGPWSYDQPGDVGVAVRVDEYATTKATRVTVEHCRVHNFPFDGLWAREMTSQIHFLHNESYDNQGNGIEIEAQDSSILDNDVHNNEHQGIEIYSAAQRIRVAGNRFYGNLEGIKLIEDPTTYSVLSYISIVGNDVSNNSDSGILYQGTGTISPGGIVTITGNTVTGNTYGFIIGEAGTGFVISDNVVSGNTSIDITISQANNILVANNVLTALPGSKLPEYGILVQPGSSMVTLSNNVLGNSANIPINQEQQINRQGLRLPSPPPLPRLQETAKR